MHAVEMPTPNKWEMGLYSTFVSNLHIAMAILLSTDIAVRTVLVRCKFVPREVHKYRKVALLTQEFLFHSRSSQDAVMSVKVWLLIYAVAYSG